MLLEYLQEPPGKFSPNTIERGSSTRLFGFVTSAWRDTWWLPTPAQLQAYAQEMGRRQMRKEIVNPPWLEGSGATAGAQSDRFSLTRQEAS
jgi:hypothetical protein